MVDDIGNGIGSKGNFTLEEIIAILPPTVVVETSPGNYQCWYFFKAPEPNKRKFKGFLTSFAKAVLARRGGDITIIDVTRLGRLPVGINNKRENNDPDGPYKYVIDIDKRGNLVPFDYVHLVEADYSRRYTLDELAAAFGFEIVIEPERPKREASTFVAAINDGDGYDELCLKKAQAIYGELGDEGKLRIPCPWGGEHAGNDDAYFWGPEARFDRPYGFKCSHQTCIEKWRTWKLFCDFVMGDIDGAHLEELGDDLPYEYIAAARQKLKEAREKWESDYLASLGANHG
jgi:hypothetical protein